MNDARDPRIEHARRTIRQALFGEGPTAPQKIGRFELLDKLGEGGMGVVYSARDPSLDRKVAIKLLRAAHAAAHGGEERLQREAHALAKLSHPNVVVIHEVGLHEGQVYLVMEYVDGPNLLRWSAERATDWRAIVAKHCEAGRGLAAAHEAGFIHRDFKPENVLVGRDGRVRVLDFGLAAAGSIDDTFFDSIESTDQVADDLTLTGTVLGTPAYMAPEQHKAAALDARADQFAFCVSLWEALFGERPFSGSDLASLRAALRNNERRPVPRGRFVPRPIVDALERGLAIEPSARFPDMAALLRALRRGTTRGSSPRTTGRIAAGVLLVAGTSVALWTGSADSESTPARSSHAAPLPDDAPTDDAAGPTPNPDAPAGHVAMRRLTQTSGRGVGNVDLDLEHDRILYQDGELWIRPLAGGVPRRLELPFERVGNVVFGPDGGYLVAHRGTVSHVDAQGQVRVVGDKVAPYHGEIELIRSPDGRELFALTPGKLLAWTLDEPGPPSSTPLPITGITAGIAVSPEATRFATTTIARGQRAGLLVFDRSGSIVALSKLPNDFSSVGWLPNGALVVLEDDGHEFWCRCYHLRGDTLQRGRRSAAVGAYSRFNAIVSSEGAQLLLARTEAQNDVVVIEPGSNAARSLSAEWDGDDHDPVWRADGALAIATGRFLQRTLVTTGADAKTVTPLVEDPIAWVDSDGGGGLVFLTDTEPPSLRWMAAGATEPTEVAGALRQGRVRDLSCLAPSDCLATVQRDDDIAMVAVDLIAGRVERRFACAAGWRCDWHRRSWSYAPGGRVLMIDDAQRVLAEFDAVTGDRLRTHPEPEPGLIIQSVRPSADGTAYWITGMSTLNLTDDGPYVVMRYAPGEGRYEIVSQTRATWVFGAEPNADDSRLAADALTFHSEAWLADLGSLCDAGEGSAPPESGP